MSILATFACIPLWLGGCGGGIAEASSVAAGEAFPAQTHERRPDDRSGMDASVANSPNILYIQSASGKAITDHPLQFGRPFVAGEIPSCPQVLVDGTPSSAQVDVKTRHPDGSVRFAVISTILPTVPASGKVSVSFADGGACPPQAPLTMDEMLSPRFDFDARIALTGGTAGTASARDMLSRGHYSLWTSGPIATTALIADHKGKTFDMGPDAYKSLRPVFEVQFWRAIGKTRVRVILEAVDTEKIQSQEYDVSVHTGWAAPVPVMSAGAVKHNHMSRWTRVFWIGGAPEPVDIDYGLAYLARTRALPNYDASIHLSGTSKSAILSSWANAAKGLYAEGLWVKNMPAAGGRPDLGPHPRWMVAWLYEGSAALKDVALGQADLAAAWPMHLREGNTTKFLDRQRTAPALGLPVSGYARPTLAYSDLSYAYTAVADRVKLVGPRAINGWSPDNAHQPQPFFIPYLLTGEHFYGEQMQFWAGYSLLDLPWGLYGGYCYSKSVNPEFLGIAGQVRGVAWGLRMLAEAAWAVPDGARSVQGWMNTAVEDVITRLEGTRGVVRGSNTARPDWQWANSKGDCYAGRLANANPLRYWDEGNSGYGSTPSIQRYGAAWMYSFMMYSLNRATELGFPADALRNWLAPFFVGAAAHGGRTGYHLGDYKFPVLDAQTGAMYQTWDALNAEYPDYNGHKSWAPYSASGNSINSLDQGYGTAALTALASTYGVPGSAGAWHDFAALHYSAWGWTEDPKWAILPRGTPGLAIGSSPSDSTGPWTPAPDPTPSMPPPGANTTSPPSSSTGDASSPIPDQSTSIPPANEPALPPGTLPQWLASSAVFEWREIPDTRLDASEAWNNYKAAPGVMGKRGLFAYSGGAVKNKGSELFIAGGGHLDYAGNEIFSIKLNSHRPQWTRRIDPSTKIAPNVPYYPDGRRSASHTYWGLQFINASNRLMFFGNSPYASLPTYYPTVDGFDPEANEYEPAGTYASQDHIAGPSGIARDAQENVYVHSMTNGKLYKWTRASNKWSELTKDTTFSYGTPYAIDTKRNRMFRPRMGTRSAAYFDLENGAARVFVEITGPGTQALTTAPRQIVYDPILDAYWLWATNDSNLYRIDAKTFVMTVQPITGKPPSAAYKSGLHNTYGRFNYVPELRGLVLIHDPSDSVYFIRTAP